MSTRPEIGDGWYLYIAGQEARLCTRITLFCSSVHVVCFSSSFLNETEQNRRQKKRKKKKKAALVAVSEKCFTTL